VCAANKSSREEHRTVEVAQPDAAVCLQQSAAGRVCSREVDEPAELVAAEVADAATTEPATSGVNTAQCISAKAQVCHCQLETVTLWYSGDGAPAEHVFSGEVGNIDFVFVELILQVLELTEAMLYLPAVPLWPPDCHLEEADARVGAHPHVFDLAAVLV